MAQYATDADEKEKLLKIAKSEPLYKEWKIDDFGFIDMLRRCPSLKVDSSTLVYYLKPLQPR